MFRTVTASIVVVALTSLAPSAFAREGTASLSARLMAASKGRRYEPVGLVELRQAEQLFVKMFDDTEGFHELCNQWRELGWTLEEMRLPSSEATRNDTIHILYEASDRRRGRGFFAFRPHASLPLAIQSPHSFHDKHTRRISRQLFEELPIAAAAWNTVRRSVVDTAHHRDTYMNAFTRAFQQTHSRRAIVQLHGFAKEKRETIAGRNSDVIISNCTRFPGRLARGVASDLAAELDASVKLYPSQVSELGGTNNAQASIVHQHGYDNFVHIELSREFRENLRNQRTLRDGFSRRLVSSLSSLIGNRP